MQMHDWHDNGDLAFCCHLSAAVADNTGAAGRLMIFLNPEARELEFSLPRGHWQIALDSSADLCRTLTLAAPAVLTVPPRAVVVLRAIDPPTSD